MAQRTSFRSLRRKSEQFLVKTENHASIRQDHRRGATHNQWAAWLNDLPQVAFGGEYPSEAIWRLLRHVGEHCFDMDEIIAVEDGTRNGHLEFLMPLVGFRRIPVPSLN